MVERWRTTPATIETPTAGELDANLDVTEGAPSTQSVDVAWFPATETENTANADLATTTLTVFLPSDAIVSPSSRLVMSDATWEFVGAPKEWPGRDGTVQFLEARVARTR